MGGFPRFGYNAPAQHLGRKPKLPMRRPRFPDLPSLGLDPVRMQDHPAPKVEGLGFLDKLQGFMEGPGGDATGNMGLALLQQSGYHPQGTTPTLGEALGRAGIVGQQTFKEAKEKERQEGYLRKMERTVRDPDLLSSLTPAQRVLVEGLPPAQAMEVMTNAAFSKAEVNRLMAVQDPGSNRTLLVNPITGQTVREVELGEEHGTATFQKLDDGTMVAYDPRIRGDEGPKELFRISPDAQVDVAKRSLELRNQFETKLPVKVWQESEVQLRAAQEAAAAKNGSADLSLMIAAAKILDPNSVVREGEIGLQDMAASTNDQVRGLAKQWFTNDGRLSDNMRTNILNTVERTARQRWLAFEQEKAHLAPLFRNLGVRPEDIFGHWSTPTYVTLSQPGAPSENPGGIPDPQASGTMSTIDFFPNDTIGGPGG